MLVPSLLSNVWQSSSGAPVYQLDLWMNGEQDIRSRLHEAAAEADLLLIEGVMGLFDGGQSSADLAQRFGLPVLVVTNVDDHGEKYRIVAAPVQFDETPPGPARAPEHGQHTEEILLELDVDWDDIARAKELRVIL